MTSPVSNNPDQGPALHQTLEETRALREALEKHMGEQGAALMALGVSAGFSPNDLSRILAPIIGQDGPNPAPALALHQAISAQPLLALALMAQDMPAALRFRVEQWRTAEQALVATERTADWLRNIAGEHMAWAPRIVLRGEPRPGVKKPAH